MRLVAGAVCFALLGFIIVILVLDALLAVQGCLVSGWPYTVMRGGEGEREREMTLEVGISP